MASASSRAACVITGAASSAAAIAGESATATFYSAEGLRRVARHLSPGGILAVWSCADAPQFETVLREVFSQVETETTLFEDDLFGEDDETNWLFFASRPR